MRINSMLIESRVYINAFLIHIKLMRIYLFNSIRHIEITLTPGLRNTYKRFNVK